MRLPFSSSGSVSGGPGRRKSELIRKPAKWICTRQNGTQPSFPHTLILLMYAIRSLTEIEVKLWESFFGSRYCSGYPSRAFSCLRTIILSRETSDFNGCSGAQVFMACSVDDKIIFCSIAQFGTMTSATSYNNLSRSFHSVL